MKKNFYSRKGFTLVELLIVIVVIGILSAMMMLSATEAMSSARAAKIISDLRNLKTAITAWYVDHTDLVDMSTGKVREKVNSSWTILQNLVNSGNDKLGMKKYLNNENWSFNEGKSGSDPIKAGGYGVCDGGSSSGTDDGAYRTSWFVGYKFADNEDSVKEKLYGRAKSLGLVFSNKTPNNYNGSSGSSGKAEGDKIVWMRVFGDYKVTTNPVTQ